MTPTPKRIDRWRQRLTPRQIELFEHYAGNTLELMGYATIHGITARPPSSWEHRRMLVADLVLPYWRRMRYFKRHGAKSYRRTPKRTVAALAK